jgi:hypothetical protein
MSYKYKPRVIPSRFTIGTVVEIRAMSSTYAGTIGTVIRVRSSLYHHTLDKYLVRLSSGIEREFWDTQLRKVHVAA